jgi:hypothetical protein
MATDIEVHIDFAPGLKRVGTLHRQARRGVEAISFEYHPDWLSEPARFSLVASADAQPRSLRSNVSVRSATPVGLQ